MTRLIDNELVILDRGRLDAEYHAEVVASAESRRSRPIARVSPPPRGAYSALPARTPTLLHTQPGSASYEGDSFR